MANATQTIRTGLAVLGGSKVNSYSLEFLTPSGKYQAGKVELIVVPFVELGRANTCAVQLGEDTPTVSRKHASIRKEGDSFFIEHLSDTNPTLVNGKVINQPTQLKNGDEIKLSYEGPRLRFILSEGAKVGFTRRINLVAKQAIKPYRTALITVVVLFIAVGILGAYVISNLTKEADQLVVETEELKSENVELKAEQEQLRQKILKNKIETEESMKETVEAYEQALLQQRKNIDSLKRNINPDDIVAKALDKVKNSVLYISLKNIRVELDGEIIMDEPQPNDCHCTGFLLNDGRLITARHCVDWHSYSISDFTVIANNGGNVTYEFIATSPDKSLEIEFTNHDMTIDKSSDILRQVEYGEQTVNVAQAGIYDGKDWAVFQTDYKGRIKSDNDLAQKLKLGTVLHCLGYTYGSSYQDMEDGLAVLYSKASVAKEGLDNNTIMVSGYSFDHGNSGGPLFVINRQGDALAVGVVSAGYTDPTTSLKTDALGSAVPISNIPN